jgi:multidrug efflux pump subunit AcrA (membrane-fusion protein)
MNRHLIGMLVLAALTVLSGCSKKASDEESGSAAGSPVVEVKAVPVSKGDVEDAIVVEGATDVLRREKIVAPVAGIVFEVRKIEGAPVRSADTLALIRTTESQAAIAGASVLVRTAATEAQKEEARRSYDLALASQNVVAIRPMSDGVVASRAVNAGELVAEGAELFAVTDLSSMYFAANIPLKDLAAVRAGARCLVSFPSMPGVAIPATVGMIEPSADPGSQSVKARLVFAHSPAIDRSVLKTEMYGTARIVTGLRRGVLLVPLSAVLRDDETNTASVVIVSPDSIARALQVTVGAAADNLVEVAGEGLREGQLVIIEGNYGLPDSTRVRLRASEKP